MRVYENKEELKIEINKTFGKYISEFDNIQETLKDKRVDEVDRTPAENLAYQLGWTTLVLKWGEDKRKGLQVKTPSDEFKSSCKCDRDREHKNKERQKKIEVERVKNSCFSSIVQWTYKFENYKGNRNQSLTIAKNFVRDYEVMKKENVRLLFYESGESGKTYLACFIANALIERYQVSVKVRNFSQIINELQKGGFDFDKNAYIESLVNTSVLILDDLGIERYTSYAKEQVYNIVNSRYLTGKPTIFTTNLPYDTFANAYESVEYQRMYSRVMEMCIPVMVVGENYRMKIQKEKLKRNKKRLLRGGESI